MERGWIVALLWLAVVSIVASSCGSIEPSPLEHRRAGEAVLDTIGRCNAAWNEHDQDELQRCYSAEAVRHYVEALPALELSGATAIVEKEAAFWAGASDARRFIEFAIAGEKEIAVGFHVRGTHSDRLSGIAATKRKLRYRVAMWITFDDDGRISREDVYVDATTQHAQLGFELRRAPPLADAMRDVSVSVASRGTKEERAHIELFKAHNEARRTADWDALAATIAPLASWRSVNWDGTNQGREQIVEFARARYRPGLPARSVESWLAADSWLAIRFDDPFPAADKRDPEVERKRPGKILGFFRIEAGQLVERYSFENPTRWWANGRGLDPAALRFGAL